MNDVAQKSVSPVERLTSLDIFRGLVIVVMTYVNYLSPVKDVPEWAKHRQHIDASLEGYTFVDVVFPAFLFMVGIAIPYALQRRLDRGDSVWALVAKIFLRTAGLLLLGVITVADHAYAKDQSMAWWFLFAFICAMAALIPWEKTSLLSSKGGEGAKRRVGIAIQIVAAVGLVVLLAVFREKDANGNTVWLQHSYWGMLGMIGWAYLASSLCWLAVRDNAAAQMGILGFMLALFIGGKYGALNWLGPVQDFINVGVNFGTNAATVMMGVIVATWLRAPGTTKPLVKFGYIMAFGIGLYVAGSLVRPLHGINKSDHTESYALVTGGICCVFFALVYWLADIRKLPLGQGFLAPVGQNALIAYLLPYVVGDLFRLLERRPYWSEVGAAGALDAGFLTVVILVVVWMLSRWRVQMRL